MSLKNRYSVLDALLVRAIETLREHPGKAVFAGLYEIAAPVARALARRSRADARVSPAARLIRSRLQVLRSTKAITFDHTDGWRVMSAAQPQAGTHPFAEPQDSTDAESASALMV